MTPWAGFCGLLAGTLGAAATWALYYYDVIAFRSDLDQSFWGAIVAFVTDAVVTVVVSLMTQPKPEKELAGLVYGVSKIDMRGDDITAGPGTLAW